MHFSLLSAHSSLLSPISAPFNTCSITLASAPRSQWMHLLSTHIRFIFISPFLSKCNDWLFQIFQTQMYLVVPYQQCAETRLGIEKIKPKALHLHLVLNLSISDTDILIMVLKVSLMINFSWTWWTANFLVRQEDLLLFSPFVRASLHAYKFSVPLGLIGSLKLKGLS